MAAVKGVKTLSEVGSQCEVHSTQPTWLPRRAPLVAGAATITSGHIVLARTLDDLDASRSHERVHVRQYERWGPFFIPAPTGSCFSAKAPLR